MAERDADARRGITLVAHSTGIDALTDGPAVARRLAGECLLVAELARVTGSVGLTGVAERPAPAAGFEADFSSAAIGVGSAHHAGRSAAILQEVADLVTTAVVVAVA